LKPKAEAVAQTRWPETEIQRLKSELEATNQILKAFSYSVSHDLRAPLRHIAGYVYILQSSASPMLDQTARKHLRTVAQSAERLDQMLEALLDWFRAGSAPMEWRSVSISGLAEDARRKLHHEIKDRPIDWRLGDLPDAWGDPARLHEVVGNLLSNAIKFTRDRSKPRIEMGTISGEGETIYFVRDNGVGFDMDRAGQLFGVFQRLHAAGEYEGVGVGLAKVRLLVNQLGGRTWAEAKKGAGATFYFSIPDPSEGA